jgi:hypothetical protein
MKICSDGLLTLSGLICKKLVSPGFAERSTNMLFKRAEYIKMVLACQENLVGEFHSLMARFAGYARG